MGEETRLKGSLLDDEAHIADIILQYEIRSSVRSRQRKKTRPCISCESHGDELLNSVLLLAKSKFYSIGYFSCINSPHTLADVRQSL